MILDEIKKQIHIYSPSEKKIANFVIEQPNGILEKSIGEISTLINVSEPTVIRFCRKSGFNGFKEFKFRLTNEMANMHHYVQRGIKVGDTAEIYINTISRFTINSLYELSEKLEKKIIEEVVFTLSNASRIEFWGYGASGSVALDAHHKFFRLGIPCSNYSDPHMQCMSGSILDSTGVIVVISHTGKSKDLIENVKIAREAGASVIGITSTNSPLAEHCSLVINVEIDEDTNVYTPQVSRIAHLMIIDILVVGVTLQKGERVTEKVKAMKKIISDKKHHFERR